MANALYNFGRESFLNGTISWTNDNIKVALVDTDNYSVNTGTHQHFSDVNANEGAIVAISPNLSSTTATAGVADAADVTFSAVSGSTAQAIVIYKDTGNQSTSPLIAYIDTGTNLPITPDGSDITITWDNGSNKIFKL